MKAAADICYTRSEKICWEIFVELLKTLGLKDENIQQFRESSVDFPFPNQVSQSVLEIFDYNNPNQNKEVVPCPMHSDVGALTLIPVAFLDPALQLFNFSSGEWCDVETNAPKNCACLFAGETLNRLLNQFIGINSWVSYHFFSAWSSSCCSCQNTTIFFSIFILVESRCRNRYEWIQKVIFRL
jgi:hypothetical protein